MPGEISQPVSVTRTDTVHHPSAWNATGVPRTEPPSIPRSKIETPPAAVTAESEKPPETPGNQLITKAKEMIVKEAAKADGKFAAKSDTQIAKDAETQLLSLAEQVKQGKVTQTDYDKQMKDLVDRLSTEQKKLQLAIEDVKNADEATGKVKTAPVTYQGVTINIGERNAIPAMFDLLSQIGPDGQALSSQLLGRLAITDGKPGSQPIGYEEFMRGLVPKQGTPQEVEEQIKARFNEFLQKATFAPEASPQTQEAKQPQAQEKFLEYDALCSQAMDYLESPYYWGSKDAKIADRSKRVAVELLIASKAAAQNGEKPLTVVALKHFKDLIREVHPPGTTAEKSYPHFDVLDARTKVLDGARSAKRIAELEAAVNTLDDAGKQELENAKAAQNFLDGAKKQVAAFLYNDNDAQQTASLRLKELGKTITAEERTALQTLLTRKQLLETAFDPDENNKLHTGEIITGLFADARFDNPADYGKALQGVELLQAHPDVINFLKKERDTLNMIVNSFLGDQRELLEYFRQNPHLLKPEERGVLAMLNRYKNMFGGALVIAFLGGAQREMDFGVTPVETGGQSGYAPH